MMREYDFKVEPRDLLFLRDARPMEASDAGLGANWPRPDQIWNAFINAFHNQWPDIQQWEHAHRRNERDKNPDSSFRFGSLLTLGPFPNDGKTVWLPCPLDLVVKEEKRPENEPRRVKLVRMGLRKTVKTETNLPSPLSMMFESPILTKTSPPRWIPAAAFAEYLAGAEEISVVEPELHDTERRIGIAIDPETGTTGAGEAKGRIYQAEYLRLRDDVTLMVKASCDIVGPGGNSVDILAKVAENGELKIICGGQQGVASVRKSSAPLELPGTSPPSPPGSGRHFLRWTTIAPSIFPEIKENKEKGIRRHPGGWLPTWVSPEDGSVMLPAGNASRRDGESRADWRARISRLERIPARLAAARIGKPERFSGWSLKSASKGPKPTRLAVPAGSVYVFECESPKAFADLWSALHSTDGEVKRRSGVFGEKGFGVGLCSLVDENEIIR